jgi:hypothetical protein
MRRRAAEGPAQHGRAFSNPTTAPKYPPPAPPPSQCMNGWRSPTVPHYHLSAEISTRLVKVRAVEFPTRKRITISIPCVSDTSRVGNYDSYSQSSQFVCLVMMSLRKKAMKPAASSVVTAWSEILLLRPPRQACGEQRSILAFDFRRNDEVRSMIKASSFNR